MGNRLGEIIGITGSTKRFGKEIYALASSMRKEGKLVSARGSLSRESVMLIDY